MAEGRRFDIGNGGRTSDVYLVAVGVVLFDETGFCAWSCLAISMVPDGGLIHEAGIQELRSDITLILFLIFTHWEWSLAWKVQTKVARLVSDDYVFLCRCRLIVMDIL